MIDYRLCKATGRSGYPATVVKGMAARCCSMSVNARLYMPAEITLYKNMRWKGRHSKQSNKKEIWELLSLKSRPRHEGITAMSTSILKGQ